jgi:hypothetical protein
MEGYRELDWPSPSLLGGHEGRRNVDKPALLADGVDAQLVEVINIRPK